MPADRPAGRDGSTRPRVIVRVTATADGRVTLSRMERLLDDAVDIQVGAHGTIWAHYEVAAR